MSYRSPVKAPESRWMVRAKDGVVCAFAEGVIHETDQHGRLQFLEIPYDDAVLIGQLPHDVAARLYIESKDGRSWDLSPDGTGILGMDAHAKRVVEEGRPEGREVLEERKARLSELAKDDPHPLAYALVQLCLSPKSSDPRYADQRDYLRVVKHNQEKVLEHTKDGKLRPFSNIGDPHFRVMDLVRYLAEDKQRHYPVCDFLWRHAYRQIVIEGWTPECPHSEAAVNRILRDVLFVAPHEKPTMEGGAAGSTGTAATAATKTKKRKRRGGRPKGSVANVNDPKIEKLWTRALKNNPKLTKKSFFDNPPPGTDFREMGYHTYIQLECAIERARTRRRGK